MTPSIKALMREFHLEKADAAEIKAWLQYRIGEGDRPKRSREQTRAWIGRCNNPPSRSEVALANVAEILTGDHAQVECQNQNNWQSIGEGPAYEWIDMGDSYASTILCYPSGHVKIGCYADLPENAR